MKKLILMLMLLIPIRIFAQNGAGKCPPGWERQSNPHKDCMGFVLPVTFLSFRTLAEQNLVYLKWEFSEPQNHSHFLLERSFDARQFEIIKETPSTRYIDYPGRCGQVYYRLSSIDLDGTIHGYKIISATVKVCSSQEPIYNLTGQQLRTSAPPKQQIFILRGEKKIIK